MRHQPPKPLVVLSHGSSRLASHKDLKPEVSDSKPQLGIYSRTFTQLRNKDPIGYNVTPQIHPQIALPLGRSPPHLMLWAWKSIASR